MSAGTEFYLAFPANLEVGAADAKYVRLYIASGVATRVDIYALGQFRGSVTTKPNDIVTFDLSNNEAQLMVRDEFTAVPPDTVYPGQAVRIVSEDPIVVYGMNRTSFTSDGLLALPVNALGREYVVASAAANVPNQGLELPSQFMIAAPYDNTQVTITTPMATPNHGQGERYTITVNKGDVFSSMSVGFKGDLSGAHIRASKPIAVTAGQNCTYLPDENYRACDHIVEMLTPVESWGKHYHAIPFQNRSKGDTYRIFAGESNADVFVNGIKLATLTSVGGTSGSGWIEFREDSRRPLDFSSNKKIFVAQYNNSQTYDNAGGSDPFYVVLTPVEQYRNELIFTTPGQDFLQNFITIVGDSAAIADAEITRMGANDWRKLSTLDGSTAYTFPTLTDGKSYRGVSVSIQPGAYQLRSSGPIAGQTYAGSAFDSYGYPAFLSAAVVASGVDKQDSDAPAITYTRECDGSVAGIVTDEPDDDMIRSNLSTVRLHPGSVNYTFDVTPFIANLDRSTAFTMNVDDPSRDAVAIVVATDAAGNMVRDTISYIPRRLPVTLSSYAFAMMPVGSQRDAELTARNTGNTPLENLQIVLRKGTEGFEVLDPVGSFSLAPGEERTVQVRFTASASGTFSDDLGVVDDCGFTWLATLDANVGAGAIVVTDWDFGSVKPGATAEGRVLIRNTGEIPITISGMSGPNDPVFTVTGNPLTFPFQMMPAEQRELTVRFIPEVEGDYLDSIVFQHDAPADPLNDPVAILNGRGDEVGAVAGGAASGTSLLSLRVVSSPAEDGVAELEYFLPARSSVSINLYTVTGRPVRTFELPEEMRGVHRVSLDMTELPSGMYFCSLHDGTHTVGTTVTIVR